MGEASSKQKAGSLEMFSQIARPNWHAVPNCKSIYMKLNYKEKMITQADVRCEDSTQI